MKFKGSLLKKTRQEQGHKQYFFAHLLGISQAHLSKIENDKTNPSLLELINIVKILKRKLGVHLNLGQTSLLLDIQEFSLVSIFKNIIQYANKSFQRPDLSFDY